MTVLNGSGDDGMMRIWATIAELSEQLTQHRAFTAGLQAQIGVLKNQAVHSQTGFPLRRFNLDKTKEAYEAELERMTNALASENQSLAHDNKQLNALIKEYEQTLENIMTTFRNRAHEVQERELALIRNYEEQLLTRETIDAERSLRTSTDASNTIARLSDLLRRALRAAGGEDASLAGIPLGEHPDAEEEDWAEAAVAEWALEREAELARVERENEELRRLVAGQAALEAALAMPRPPPPPPPPPSQAVIDAPTAPERSNVSEALSVSDAPVDVS